MARDPQPEADLGAEEHLAVLGSQCGDFALQCSDVAGFVNQVNGRIDADHARLEALRASVAHLADLQGEANEAAGEIRFVAAKAGGIITEGHATVLTALGEIGGLIDTVLGIGEELEAFAAALDRVASISGELEGIARHTGMLAINASIEAARAGSSASGFAAVAAEVKRLAGSARAATASVTGSVSELEARARRVIGGMRAGAERGRDARARTGEIGRALESIAALVVQFDQRTGAIESCGAHITAHVGTLDRGLDGFTSTAAQNVSALVEARDRLDGLESASNAMLDGIAHSGAAMRDRRFIDLARARAAEADGVVGAALADGSLSAAALFDADYRAIPGSDPPQYRTGFVPFADARLRPLLDAATAEDIAIVGCALVDRNGFLPTHITERSQTQRPGERAWNLEHARNRQIFMDRQTRAALDREGDWFLFTYRQDFGDGRYRALRSVFVPLRFAGRRWGMYELGYMI